MTGALGLAFLTGMLATVNPCGFAMLPTYLAYFIGSGPGSGPKRPLLAGLRAGIALSAGFGTVFVTAGLLVAVGLRSIASALPWAAVVIGAVIVIAGLGMIVGWQLPGTRLNLNRFFKTDGTASGLKGVFGYGVA
ncbi:cytochrome c biogenesis CcdA family protein [Arthrobacter sp. HLT1-21]